MSFLRLREFTPARVGLGRAGNSLPTRELLDFQLAHARARDAVHAELDAAGLALELTPKCGECLLVHSEASDRATYLRRPDLGRRLAEDSRELLTPRRGKFDAVFVVADGLSALAVHRHAPPFLESIMKEIASNAWQLAPVVIVKQGRVAIGDEIGECLSSTISVVLIGERPGLSVPDSLGVYLTWNPRPGLTDADRNCVSNIHAAGLNYQVAAARVVFLMTEARQRKLSGVGLKEDARLLE